MKQFTIKINNTTYTSDNNGYLNLNDIFNQESLPDSKRPNKWRSDTSRQLYSNSNLSPIQINHLGAGTSTYIGGDELATVAYAMWISFDFYKTVVESFVALRNGEVEKAMSLAGSTLSEQDEAALNKWMNYKETSLREVGGMLGCAHTMKFIDLVKNDIKTQRTLLAKGYIKSRKYGQDFEQEYWNTYNRPLTAQWKMTPKGKQWFKENIETINERLTILKQGAK